MKVNDIGIFVKLIELVSVTSSVALADPDKPADAASIVQEALKAAEEEDPLGTNITWDE